METVKIESEVPFGRAIDGWLCVNGRCVDDMVAHGYVERSYLAWESVRKELNPFFQQGTGFEGYLIGRCESPEAALEAILGISQHILDSIARLYRFEYPFRRRLMRTLSREISDPQAIHIWSAHLGAELGRLRAGIIGIPEAQLFQTRTYRLTSQLPPMAYHQLNNDITQTYVIGAAGCQSNKLGVTRQILKSDQQDAWLIAENIGEFGHPLVRRLMDR